MMEQETVLVMDAGNTRTKLALFQGGRPVRLATMPNGDIQAVAGMLGDTRPDWIAFASVGHQDDVFMKRIHEMAPVIEVRGDSPAPIQNAYTTPATLGVDRLANAVAASVMFPRRRVLAIDAGTCITYDLVDAGGTYLGGAISPGLRMRASAMHTGGARLPLVEPDPGTALIGNDTQGSLRSGIFHGTIVEMRGMIQAYTHQEQDMAVIITGGDALACTRALKSGIFAHPYLTLHGIYALSVHVRLVRGAAGAGAGAGAAG